MAAFRLLICCVLLVFPHFSHSIPEPGKLTMVFDSNGEYRGFSKALYKDATISVKGKCSSSKDKPEITIRWRLKYTQCADFFLGYKDLVMLWELNRQYELSGSDIVKCTPHISLMDGSKQKEHIEPPTVVQKLNSTAKTLESKLSTITAKKRQDNGQKQLKKDVAKTIISDKKLAKRKRVHPANGPKKKLTKKTMDEIESRRRRALDDDENQTGQDTYDDQVDGDSENQLLLNHLADVPAKQQHPKRKSNSPLKRHQKTDISTAKIKKMLTAALATSTTKPTNVTTINKINPPTDHQVDSDPSKKKQGTNRIVTSRRDGIYMLIVTVEAYDEDDFHLELEVAMESKSGYLSATDWPLLPFYGVMSLVYLFYGVVWLIVSACQWRDLLRIQFWIGGVIALGMLEKAVFYSEYNNINHTGIPTPSLVVFAEVVSVSKRTLARMLVIIVSMGFGIVKPRLGKSLHRVLGVGALYFILAIVEGSMRSLSLKADPSKEQLIAGIPLAVLDAAICWWIFMSLVQTTRTLRIRRNVVKLSLYRHFTNTLIFAVLASVTYMIWSIKTHRFAECLKDWSELWLDEAFWHFLFSIILLVIMILWRPTANNQRYAFTPIVDFDDDDEQDNVTLSEAFDGMKMRNTRTEVIVSNGDTKKKAEDDLKWVEENIPSSAADTVLPSVLDSDEELMTTKFEMSKMD